jgi:hypothetical protein
MAGVAKAVVFWRLTSSSVVSVHRRFGGKLHPNYFVLKMK